MANWWSLKVIAGDDPGKVFTLKKDRTVIGRTKGDVVLRDDIELSSVHAEITYDSSKGLMILQDLKSRNGCKVNGEKVEKRALLAGDKVRVGATEFVVEPPASEETIASTPELPPPPPPDETKETVVPEQPVVAKSPAGEKLASAADAKERFSEVFHPDFSGFFGRFFGVLFYPTQFFDFLASENAIIDGEQAFKSAIKFGAINWIVGGIISTTLSYYCMFVWKTVPTGVDYGRSPFAMGLTTVVGLFLLPALALLYHWICLSLGGKGPFKVAVRILCYLSAIHFVKDLAGLIPKMGPFLAIVSQCYIIYLFSLAATRLYFVSTKAALASCATLIAITVAVMISGQRSAMQLQAELIRLNPLLNKSIGATISVTPQAQPVPQATPVPKPVPEPALEAALAQPAAPLTSDGTTPTDGDPEPPKLPETDGDPEPPKFPD